MVEEYTMALLKKVDPIKLSNHGILDGELREFTNEWVNKSRRTLGFRIKCNRPVIGFKKVS